MTLPIPRWFWFTIWGLELLASTNVLGVVRALIMIVFGLILVHQQAA